MCRGVDQWPNAPFPAIFATPLHLRDTAIVSEADASKDQNQMTPDDLARKTLPWLVFLTIGSVAGAWLGNAIVSDFRPQTTASITAYAELSGNPDALLADSHPFTPCENCADGYGNARYASEERVPDYEDGYRALGRVEIAYPQSEVRTHDYQYRGGFPERSLMPDTEPVSGTVDSPEPADVTNPKKGDSTRGNVQPLKAQPDAIPLDRRSTPLIY